METGDGRCQEGQAECGPGQRCSGLCLGCEGTALNYARVREDLHAWHQRLRSSSRASGGGSRRRRWKRTQPTPAGAQRNQEVFLEDCRGVTGAQVTSKRDLLYLAPFHNLISLPSHIAYIPAGVRPSLCFAPWAITYTLQRTWRVATFNRMHCACTLYKCKLIFRGLESENPGLLTAKHRPYHLLNAFFPGLNVPSS